MAAEKDKLKRYRGKRDFAATSEPAGDPAAGGDPASDAAAPRFVVQEHHARRLHWDLRLEHDGVLASWAVPNGLPATPKDNRLAVHTEDHPLQYLDFAGEIPAGEYGAGHMSVWDTGTYELHKWAQDKVEVSFHGERLQGRYGLFPIGHRADGSGSEKDWMIHRMDPPQDPEREPMPEHLQPMLAGAGDLPRDGDSGRWSFEVKWDGVRALAYLQPGRIRLESRNGNEITAAYPELRGILEDLGMREAVLDGEIVAFDGDGRPSFERLQRRMHVSSESAIKRLQKSTPVVLAIFDLLYLDGHVLMGLPYDERRTRLEALGLGGTAWRVPAVYRGDQTPGSQLLAATAAQGLEGIVAKRRDARYEPGRRTGAWIKIKHLARQEVVIGGWLPGEGRRQDRIGALLMGVRDAPAGSAPGPLRYAGRVGTGFTERTLDELGARLGPLRTDRCPFDPRPKLPRNAVWAQPELVAEVEFREWTSEGVMRAPSFKGLRDDKAAAQVVREPGPVAIDAPEPEDTPEGGGRADPPAPAPTSEPATGPVTPEALFGDVTRRPDGALAVIVDGRALKLTNWDKVLFPQTGFTKGDLIAYYVRVAPALLPHLHDRPLTLKRYPNGVNAPFFYEKNAPAHRPKWVQTTRVGEIDYVLCEDRATLVWLANLADIELHTSLSLAGDAQRPSSVVFDLDPGEGVDLVGCSEVALVLRGLFAALELETVVKTSGSKGMQVYVPLNSEVAYAQTKPLARQVAEALEQRLPELVVSRMTKRLRPGRILVDWSQNDAHKTTVSVYSVRARDRPTVSTPLDWDEVRACHDSGDAGLLTFETDDVLARVARDGDRFAELTGRVQALPRGR